MENSILNKILTSFLIILITILSCHTITVSATRPIIKSQKTNTDFIKTSCSTTTYPTLCYTSLANQAKFIQTSPKLLANAALNVTLSTVRSTTLMMIRLTRSSGMGRREVGAMEDCLEELSDSVDELRRSIDEMGKIKSSNFEISMSNVQTWVSAALTDETTCSDGFEGNSKNGKAVRGGILKVSHLTSNALALVNSYASLQA